jgi:hypothetical protein
LARWTIAVGVLGKHHALTQATIARACGAFVTSLIKSDGGILPFFERPFSAVLAAQHDRRVRRAGLRVGAAEADGNESSCGTAGLNFAQAMRGMRSPAPSHPIV